MAPSAEPQSHYVPTQGYSDKRQYEAPRFNVPPPDLNYRNGLPKLDVEILPYNRTSSDYGSPGFLADLSDATTNDNLDLTHKMLTWKWEMRREAQHILPFLLVGPTNTVRDPDYIRINNITMVIAVRPSKSIRTRPTFLDPKTFASCSELQTMTFDFDYPAEFISLVKPVIRAMNDHLEMSCAQRPLRSLSDIRGKILLFCESGNDRSALLASAYLMTVYGLAAINAINTVQSQRFCMTLSDELKKVLVDLQDITMAERQVADASTVTRAEQNLSMSPSIAVQLPRPSKRNVDDFYQSDEEMYDDFQQVKDTGHRKGVAPFMDTSSGG